MTKKNKKIGIDRKNDTINIESFLTTYCNVPYRNGLNKLTHFQVKHFKFEGVKTISFKEVCKDEVMRGDVLIVLDGHHNPAPYVNPLLVHEQKKEEVKILKRGVNNDKY